MSTRFSIRVFAASAIAATLLPTAAFAQPVTTGVTNVQYQFSREGIFGCSKNNSYAQSVGSQVVIGGVYVPVSDAAVTLNTGILVYKECILREVLIRQREAATANITKQYQQFYTTGREGKPLFAQDISKEQMEVRDAAWLRNLQNSSVLGTLNPQISESVKRALAQGYIAGTRSANSAFGCNYQDLAGLYRGNPQGSIFGAIRAMQTPGCDQVFAYESARNYLTADAEGCVREMMQKLEWGDGTYPLETSGGGCDRTIVTPASTISANNIYTVQSGFRQLENASDIGQIVGSLFSGMISQVTSGSGLLGLAQSSAGQPSYLDRLIQDSAAGLAGAAANAALQTILGALDIERAYNAAVKAIVKKLSETSAALRADENTCWNLIIEKVCSGTPSGGKCAGKSGSQLTIATSTRFSQPIIESKIAPLQTPTAANITTSDAAVALLAQLATSVTNTASPAAQRAALEQIDRLVAEQRLHGSADLRQVQQSQTAVNTSMETLLQDTRTAWADSTDPQVGWCNVNEAAVVARWDSEWK